MATTDKVEQDISPGPDWVGSLSTMPAWEAILIGVRTTVGRGPGKGPLFHGETLKGYLPTPCTRASQGLTGPQPG